MHDTEKEVHGQDPGRRREGRLGQGQEVLLVWRVGYVGDVEKWSEVRSWRALNAKVRCVSFSLMEQRATEWRSVIRPGL